MVSLCTQAWEHGRASPQHCCRERGWRGPSGAFWPTQRAGWGPLLPPLQRTPPPWSLGALPRGAAPFPTPPDSARAGDLLWPVEQRVRDKRRAPGGPVHCISPRASTAHQAVMPGADTGPRKTRGCGGGQIRAHPPARLPVQPHLRSPSDGTPVAEMQAQARSTALRGDRGAADPRRGPGFTAAPFLLPAVGRMASPKRYVRPEPSLVSLFGKRAFALSSE